MMVADACRKKYDGSSRSFILVVSSEIIAAVLTLTL